MYDNLGGNSLEGIHAGINSGFKLVNHTVSDSGWRWTFKKNNFETNYLGNWPYLSDDKRDKWEAINRGWAGELISKFKEFIPDSVVSAKIKEISAQINEEISPDDQKEKEGILKGAKILYENLMDLATDYLGEAEFNVVLFYQLGVDKEGNEKYYLNIPLMSTKVGSGNKWQDNEGVWQGGYAFAVGKNPPMNPNLLYVKPKVEGEEEPAEPVDNSPIEAEADAPQAEPSAFPTVGDEPAEVENW